MATNCVISSAQHVRIAAASSHAAHARVSVTPRMTSKNRPLHQPGSCLHPLSIVLLGTRILTNSERFEKTTCTYASSFDFWLLDDPLRCSMSSVFLAGRACGMTSTSGVQNGRGQLQ
eukprot:5355737-Pyramimonas_sp.AAC.1